MCVCLFMDMDGMQVVPMRLSFYAVGFLVRVRVWCGDVIWFCGAG